MNRHRMTLLVVGLGLLVGGLCLGLATDETADPPRIDVILWFDTEDYLLPASDDAAKRLAEMLSQRGIRATFKIVGEKARTLERRGRQDAIAALQEHAIGYHTDFHSVHPTPSEYLAECGFLDGVAEFVRRESQGAADVRRIFGLENLACYGQPGSSWAAQAVAGLRQIRVAPMGVPCYVDEGEHVGLNHQPFWYAGAIQVYDMGPNCTRMELHDPSGLEAARREFTAIVGRLRREQGGGLVSIYYHPCEWVHRQFWDGVNFARGHNPPREEWKRPPQRPPEETETAFGRFAEYMDYIRSVPGVRFVTANDLPALYPDRIRTEGVTGPELNELARRIVGQGSEGVNFEVIGGKAFSVADQLESLAVALGDLLAGDRIQFPVPVGGLMGPDNPPPPDGTGQQLSWPAFREVVLDLLDYIQTQQRVPARVFVGSDPVSPTQILCALATAYDWHRRNGRFPEQEGIVLSPRVTLRPAGLVAADTPSLFGGWVIHREGFRAPKILEVARLQTWTLKPALRSFGQGSSSL